MSDDKTRTNSNLFVGYFLMYSIMLPCAIHSETMANWYCLMPPRTLTSFRTFGWDSEFQRITSLQNCWRQSQHHSTWPQKPPHLSDLEIICYCNPEWLHRNSASLVLPWLDIHETAWCVRLTNSREVDLIRDDHWVGQSHMLSCKSPQGAEEHVFLRWVEFVHHQTLNHCIGQR